MALTVNQILVICLIAVLVVFLCFVGYMGVHALKLMGNVKTLAKKSESLVDKASGSVERVENSITDTFSSAVKEADTTTKLIAGIAVAIVGIYTVSRIMAVLPVASLQERRSKRAVKRSRKDLKEARKNARKAKKIMKKAEKDGLINNI